MNSTKMLTKIMLQVDGTTIESENGWNGIFYKDTVYVDGNKYIVSDTVISQYKKDEKEIEDKKQDEQKVKWNSLSDKTKEIMTLYKKLSDESVFGGHIANSTASLYVKTDTGTHDIKSLANKAEIELIDFVEKFVLRALEKGLRVEYIIELTENYSQKTLKKHII